MCSAELLYFSQDSFLSNYFQETLITIIYSTTIILYYNTINIIFKCKNDKLSSSLW